MAPVDLPYLQLSRSRGKLFAYYRRHGRRIRLHDDIGSPAFLAAYEADRAACETPRLASAPKAPPGSLCALPAFYRSPEYRQHAPGTRAGYDRVLTPRLDHFGNHPRRRHPGWALAMRDELQTQPRSANYRVAVIRRACSLFRWIEDGVLTTPAARVKALRTGAGHRIWMDHEVAAETRKSSRSPATAPVPWSRATPQERGKR